MSEREQVNKDNAGRESSQKTYTPSWADRLTAWIALRPGPSWLYYLGIGFVLFMVQSVVVWIEGAIPIGTFLLPHGYLAGAMAFLLALLYYLDEWTGSALATMRPALETSEEKYHSLQYRLTTIPARATLLVGIAVPTYIFLSEAIVEPYHLAALDAYPISANLLYIFYLMCWLVFGTFIYHAIHQLRLINHIYSKHTRIDLFQSKPLYAFSNITAFTAGSLAMISYGWLVVNPFISLNDPYVFISLLVILVLAIITFIWPQLGLHRLQVAEKERLKDVAYQRFESTTADLHRKLNEGELEDMEDLNYAISSLEIELNILRGIPTWPWEPETISVLITALALPLGLWILQFILVRVLGQ
jgi:hypothetical protein